MAISDETGAIRLLDTAPNDEGIMTEYLRMTCHDNAVFDISWSADDLKLVPLRKFGVECDRQPRQEIKQVRFSIL